MLKQIIHRKMKKILLVLSIAMLLVVKANAQDNRLVFCYSDTLRVEIIETGFRRSEQFTMKVQRGFGLNLKSSGSDYVMENYDFVSGFKKFYFTEVVNQEVIWNLNDELKVAPGDSLVVSSKKRIRKLTKAGKKKGLKLMYFYGNMVNTSYEKLLFDLDISIDASLSDGSSNILTINKEMGLTILRLKEGEFLGDSNLLLNLSLNDNSPSIMVIAKNNESGDSYFSIDENSFRVVVNHSDISFLMDIKNYDCGHGGNTADYFYRGNKKDWRTSIALFKHLPR
jgi:hypothetical protein